MIAPRVMMVRVDFAGRLPSRHPPLDADRERQTREEDERRRADVRHPAGEKGRRREAPSSRLRDTAPSPGRDGDPSNAIDAWSTIIRIMTRPRIQSMAAIRVDTRGGRGNQ